MKNSEAIIKITLAIILLLCLLDMSYGFYQFARFTALIGFGILAYKAHTETRETQMFIYGSLALLFQPFFKITLGRDIWNIVDVIVAIALIISLSLENKKSNKQKP